MFKAHTLIFCMHDGINAMVIWGFNDFSELLYFKVEGVLN